MIDKPVTVFGAIDPPIGGAAFNNQELLNEQLRLIHKNKRIIERQGIVILVEAVVIALLALATYAMF